MILDNGRTAMLGTEYQEMLRCIRCGACMNHCPVYHAIGGHAYGATYPGPMGAVLDPAIFGLEQTRHLPNASTFCGRCESVCPMMIPLPKLMRHWRDKEFERALSPATQRFGLRFWAFFATRPRALSARHPHRDARARRPRPQRTAASRRLPLAGGWTRHRDMPAPQGRTFMDLYRARKARVSGRDVVLGKVGARSASPGEEAQRRAPSPRG